MSLFLQPDMLESSVGLLKLLDHSSKANNFLGFHLVGHMRHWVYVKTMRDQIDDFHPVICISHLELRLVHIQVLNLAPVWLGPALHLLIMILVLVLVLMMLMMVGLVMMATSPRNSSSSFSSCSAVTFPSSAYSPILFGGRAHTGDPFRYRLGSYKSKHNQDKK